MALPVNKKTLDKNIEDNILLNNNSQFITAQRLQNTLYPIVNSTYGLKTIWAGRIIIDCGTTSSAGATARLGWMVTENYWDPNYFSPDNPANMTDPLNRYIVTNIGSNLLADNGTPNGPFSNKSVTNLQIGLGGYGLTFNGTVANGTLSSLSVNTVGAGYSYGVQNIPAPPFPSIYTQRMNLNLSTGSGGAVLPEIKFNLTNAVTIANTDTQYYQDYWVTNYFNVFIPNKLNAVGTSECINLSWSDAGAFTKSIETSLSRLVPAASDQTIGDIRPNISGFAFGISTGRLTNPTAFTTSYANGYLEIKVPIFNTTI